MTPSRTSRSAFLAAVERPFSLSQATACSTSPPLSSSARLQSMIPAPVCSRRAFTSSGLIIACGSFLPVRTDAASGKRRVFVGLFLCGLGGSAGARSALLLLVLLRLGLEDERLAAGQGRAVVGIGDQGRIVDRWQRLGLLELLVEAGLALGLGLQCGVRHLGADQAHRSNGIR